MTERYALVNAGIVESVIMWDGVTELGTKSLPIRSDTANIGWQYIDGRFISPVLPQIQPVSPEV